MMRLNLLLLLCAVVSCLGSGCYSPKPIPKAYFETKCDMSVAVDKCPEKAKISDSESGQGNLISAVANVGRGSAMREAMSGIVGDTVKELVRQRFSERMEEHFDVYDTGQLNTVITIQQWGWYVPTTVASIRMGAYQFVIAGSVAVNDAKRPKSKAKIAKMRVSAFEPIGNKPSAELSQEALLKCADKFASEAVAFLVKQKIAQPK